jgi:hypothetical protein
MVFMPIKSDHGAGVFLNWTKAASAVPQEATTGTRQGAAIRLISVMPIVRDEQRHQEDAEWCSRDILVSVDKKRE